MMMSEIFSTVPVADAALPEIYDPRGLTEKEPLTMMFRSIKGRVEISGRRALNSIELSQISAKINAIKSENAANPVNGSSALSTPPSGVVLPATKFGKKRKL
jgi:hypothetical protein